MGVTKPTIPREVAEAIEELRIQFADDIILRWAASGHYDGEAFSVLSNYAHSLVVIDGESTQEGGLITLASAIINGYEVEKTPHDKVREHYENLVGASGSGEYREQYLAAIDTVKIVLDLLGVTIDGINGANNAHSSADN